MSTSSGVTSGPRITLQGHPERTAVESRDLTTWTRLSFESVWPPGSLDSASVRSG